MPSLTPWLYIGPQFMTVLNLKIFLSNFEKALNDTTSCNSLFTIILGDFNARSSVWWARDKTTEIIIIQLKGHNLNPQQVCMDFIN